MSVVMTAHVTLLAVHVRTVGSVGALGVLGIAFEDLWMGGARMVHDTSVSGSDIGLSIGANVSVSVAVVDVLWPDP